ncbi:TetR/AcrR family transcriptional regulator [Streptomyces roseirectus]|uniref:TetR/AcrR family transcriptional regulator n=1 Tax=Streptomyces roseirectus TaxID=2768066 RepID=A0A7H0IJR4_9ACTN|nr:TetR/AcrR family transcriptional regulator [Streptomyces roseirectus]QNP73030.1 TetR/AcrR family transcriptional regulator [Streptomyces roseirectus]
MSPRTPDASRRSETSRRAIYAAALGLVAESGYAKTTIEGIAARAGVGKQTIYRWWGSKADVLLEAFLDLGEQQVGEGTLQGTTGMTGGALDGPQGIPDTGDLSADLKLVLRATVDNLLDPRFDAPARALTAEGLVDEKLGRTVVAKLLEPNFELYVERLRSAREAGQLRPEIDPRIALELFVAPVAQRWLQRTGELTHTYTDTLVDYALHGIAPR